MEIKLIGKEFIHDNGNVIGECIALDDGYYHFFFKSSDKCYAWPAYVFYDIAIILNNKNREWDEEVKRMLSGK